MKKFQQTSEIRCDIKNSVFFKRMMNYFSCFMKVGRIYQVTLFLLVGLAFVVRWHFVVFKGSSSPLSATDVIYKLIVLCRLPYHKSINALFNLIKSNKIVFLDKVIYIYLKFTKVCILSMDWRIKYMIVFQSFFIRYLCASTKVNSAINDIYFEVNIS